MVFSVQVFQNFCYRPHLSNIYEYTVYSCFHYGVDKGIIKISTAASVYQNMFIYHFVTYQRFSTRTLFRLSFFGVPGPGGRGGREGGKGRGFKSSLFMTKYVHETWRWDRTLTHRNMMSWCRQIGNSDLSLFQVYECLVLQWNIEFREMWTRKREWVGRVIRYMPIVVNFV